MTLNELIRTLQEIRSEEEDYDLGSLPVDVSGADTLLDIDYAEVLVDREGHPRGIRIFT